MAVERAPSALGASPPGWMMGLADDIDAWLARLETEHGPGCYRYCEEGAVFEPGPRSGLGISCFVLKTMHILGLTRRLGEERLDAWVRRIRSFQARRGRFAGFFEDPALLSVLDRRASRVRSSVRFGRYVERLPLLALVDRRLGLFARNAPIRRAETRQACATLMCVGARPEWPISPVPRMPSQVREFIASLPWEQPYAAGSHAGHLMAFLHVNDTLFGRSSDARDLLPVVTQELDRLHDAETGAWFSRRPSPQQIVNGAMKVISGYAFCSLPFTGAERLIDYCLTASNDDQGCNNADITYVLHQASLVTDHRRDEVQRFARLRLEHVTGFRVDNGGFAFDRERPRRHYYGVAMSRGLPEADVHGTLMFTWTLAMLADILGWREELGWELPVT